MLRKATAVIAAAIASIAIATPAHAAQPTSHFNRGVYQQCLRHFAPQMEAHPWQAWLYRDACRYVATHHR